MIKLIVGNKGTGKTKILIDMMNAAAINSDGNIVCIDKGTKLKYDANYKIRLINVENYGISGHDAFAGFILGVLAGNYDIGEIYFDSLLKIVGRDYSKLEEFFAKLNENTNDIKLVFTVSADLSELPESIQKMCEEEIAV